MELSFHHDTDMKLILPDPLMFGWWGSAPFPWLMILAYSQRNNTALIAHEQCHQAQQRRDGLLTFWLRYVTSSDWRYMYELEAYRVWLEEQPDDFWKVVSMMQGYGFEIADADLINALSRRGTE